MRTNLLETQDFAYYADVRPIQPPVGGYCLTISSRWLSAKDPEAEHEQFKVCLDRGGLLALSQLIQQQLT